MNQTKTTQLADYLNLIVAVTLATVTSLVILGLALAWILPADPGTVPPALLQELAVFQGDLRPEPTERTIFLFAVLSTPFFIAGWGSYFRSRRNLLSAPRAQAGVIVLILYFTIIAT